MTCLRTLKVYRPAATPKSMVVYQGPSVLDGKPILAIATGLRTAIGMASQNAKTGAMVQIWIIRADMEPTVALKTGDDMSVCGSCPMRPLVSIGTGQPRCYVNVGKGLLNIYRSWAAGNIPLLPPESATRLLAGKQVRLGAYGDPAAVPLRVWDTLLSQAQAVIGYTHQWADSRVPAALARWCMASVETLAGREGAHAAGYRTYRVDVEHRAGKHPGEVRCPGSLEAGKKLTCTECMACTGQQPTSRPDGSTFVRAADIVILPHGVREGPRERQARFPGPLEVFKPPTPLRPLPGMVVCRDHCSKNCQRPECRP